MIKINGAIFNYKQYSNWISNLASKGETSGKNQSDALIEFTKLNLKRMQRIDKTIEINNNVLDKLVSIQNKQIWYVIAEVWCGDCAQILPAIGKIAEFSNELIDLRIIIRDENPAWLEKYHTNGSKSIPKLIAFDDRKNELFTWGPRPAAAQEIFWNWKNNPNGKTWDDFEKELHTWYAKDKTKAIQSELLIMLKKSTQTTPSKKFTFSKN